MKEITPEESAAVDETAGIQVVTPEDQALAVPRETPELPSPAEAQAMFEERAGLASIETTDGVMTRDGILT